jgi:phosphatidylserine/phosphatidylglycerophosphate/cardiolipin synthase-like enzyme
MKKIIFIALSIFIGFASPVALPSFAAALERGSVPEASVDLKGCMLTLLKNRDYFRALSEKIHEARKEIRLAFFLFKTNGHPESYPEIILRELSQAVQRGVRVTVVLERDGNPASTVNRDNEETAERLKKAGMEVHWDSPKKTTHTKLAVIDGRYTFIGSHNLTQSALKHNNEMSVMIDSPAVAEKTLHYIQGLY